jgi:hypothetical protein
VQGVQNGAFLLLAHQINAPQQGEILHSARAAAPKQSEIRVIAQFWRTKGKLASQLLQFQQPNF